MNNNAIKRQKIVEREEFSYDEKMRFAAKSDNKCCHCGREVYFGYGATVEHFIPISKGGTNRDINMIMLCKECNKEKGNFIYEPEDYLPYLKEEHMEKLKGYFQSYINSFDFVNRENLLACDRYKIYITPPNSSLFESVMNSKREKKYDDLMCNKKKSYWIKRATIDDLDKLTEYFIKYLRKHDCLDSKKAAQINVLFWLTFGCIYYVEASDGIKMFATISVTKTNGKVMEDGKDIKKILSINMFVYYNNMMSMSLALCMLNTLPDRIVEEQGLKQICIKYAMISTDPVTNMVCRYLKDCYNVTSRIEGRFTCTILVMHHPREKTEDLPNLSEDKDLESFFNKFGEINRSRVERWFQNYDEETYDWMFDELVMSEERPEINKHRFNVT